MVKEITSNQRVMTRGEWFTQLSLIQAAFKWYLTKQGRIRASLKDDATKLVFDPVTAVVFLRTGDFFAEGHWTEAANAIGLPYSDCAEIVSACNYEWDPGCRQGALRQDLRTALIPKIRTTSNGKGSFENLQSLLLDS